MLAGDKGLNEWVDGGRLQALGKTTPTFVCDLTDDCATQALRLEEFLMQHRPWFLNVVGARESASEMCTFSIKERAQTILNAALR
jgi:hypothetical protein